MVAGAIVVGHAIKHLYNSGQSSLIMPEISKDLDLTRAQFGSLASVGQVALVVRDDGSGLSRRPFQQPRRPHDRHIAFADGWRDDADRVRPHLRHHAGGHVPGGDRPGDVPPAGVGGALPQVPRTAAGSLSRSTAWRRTWERYSGPPRSRRSSLSCYGGT